MTARLLIVHKNRRYILLAIILLILLYVILPQLGDFRSSWSTLQHPRWSLIIASAVFTSLTYLAGAATYYVLAFRPLPYRQVILAQLAAMFINRVLPAGIGAAGVSYAYLRHCRHKVSEAAAAVAINNLIGFLGHGLIIVITLLIFSGQAASVSSGNRLASGSLLIIIAGCVIFLAGLSLMMRSRLRRFIADTRSKLFSYRFKPGHLLMALLFSMSLTMCNIFSFTFCAMAMGVHLPAGIFILVFTLGVGAGTATPTPGGLGGFEAGLVAGLVAYHVTAPVALSAALAYRLISYWLPLLAGIPAFFICQRRRLFVAA